MWGFEGFFDATIEDAGALCWTTPKGGISEVSDALSSPAALFPLPPFPDFDLDFDDFDFDFDFFPPFLWCLMPSISSSSYPKPNKL